MSNIETFERVVINSQSDRQPSDTTHNFTAYFRNPISLGGSGRRKLYMAVSSISVPMSAYQISYANSVLYFQMKTFIGDVITEYGLQINYDKYYHDSVALAAYLTSEFSNQFSYNILVEYDNESQQLTFTNNENDKYFRLVSDRQYEPYGLNGSVLANRCNMKLGLVDDYRTQWIGYTGKLLGRGICELRRTDVVHVLSTAINNNTITPSGYVVEPILLTVPAGPYGTRSVFTPPYKNWLEVDDTSIDSIKISLVDSEFIEFDIRESNVMIMLEFGYEKN